MVAASDNAPGDARYWLAEANYVLSDWDAAAREYQGYIDSFPLGQYVQDAQYCLGWTLYMSERFDDAAARFREFVAPSGEFFTRVRFWMLVPPCCVLSLRHCRKIYRCITVVFI